MCSEMSRKFPYARNMLRIRQLPECLSSFSKLCFGSLWCTWTDKNATKHIPIMMIRLTPRFHQSFHRTVYGLRSLQYTGQRPLSITRRLAMASMSAEELRAQSCGGQCGKCAPRTSRCMTSDLSDIWHYSLPIAYIAPRIRACIKEMPLTGTHRD